MNKELPWHIEVVTNPVEGKADVRLLMFVGGFADKPEAETFCTLLAEFMAKHSDAYGSVT